MTDSKKKNQIEQVSESNANSGIKKIPTSTVKAPGSLNGITGGSVPTTNPIVPSVPPTIYDPNTNTDGYESEAVKRAREAAQYSQSSGVNDAYTAWNNHNATMPGAWNGGQYGEGYQAAIDAINNREAFSYDLNGDALYQQYKDQYLTQGKLAMQDTYGVASAMTGGYGNSYAATAGNQAYQSYVNRLNDVVPELYQLAFDKYNQETSDLYDKLNLYKNAYDTEYGQYRDQMDDWYTENQRLANNYLNFYDRERSAFESDRNYDEGVREYDSNLNEEKRQFNIGQNYKDRALTEDQRQFDKELAYKEAVAKANATTSTNGTSTSGSASDNEYLSQAQSDLEYLINHGGTYDSLTEMLKYERDDGNITPEEYDKLFALISQAYQSGKLKKN